MTTPTVLPSLQLNPAATTLPIAFAQVREDPLLDLALVGETKARSMFLIGSGGCTLAALATQTAIERFVVADINPAQLSLARLKLAALALTAPERLALLGYRDAPSPDWRARIVDALLGAGTAADLAPRALLNARGIDFIGRYEALFFALESLLADDRAAFTAAGDPHPDAINAWRTILRGPFEQAFDAALLTQLFGAAASQNSAQPFAAHFLEQTLAAIAASSTANPFLRRFLAPSRTANAAPDWVNTSAHDITASIEWRCEEGGQALARFSAAFDVVHLSNALDWLDEDAARATLHAASNALRPGGALIIRQLNSRLAIPSLSDQLAWTTSSGAPLIARDRSFFYKAVHIGRKA